MLDSENQVITKEYEFEGMFADVIGALDRSRDIVCTASKVTDKAAEKALFEGVKIILANCIKAIEDRESADDEPIIDEDD